MDYKKKGQIAGVVGFFLIVSVFVYMILSLIMRCSFKYDIFVIFAAVAAYGWCRKVFLEYREREALEKILAINDENSNQDFQDEEENPIIEIMVSEVDMGKVIGKSGKMAKAIRTLVQAAAFNIGIKRVKINIDSF